VVSSETDLKSAPGEKSDSDALDEGADKGTKDDSKKDGKEKTEEEKEKEIIHISWEEHLEIQRKKKEELQGLLQSTLQTRTVEASPELLAKAKLSSQPAPKEKHTESDKKVSADSGARKGEKSVPLDEIFKINLPPRPRRGRGRGNAGFRDNRYKDGKDYPRDSKDKKEKDTKETEASKENKESKDVKDNKDVKDSKDSKDTKNTKDSKDTKDSWNNSDKKDTGKTWKDNRYKNSGDSYNNEYDNRKPWGNDNSPRGRGRGAGRGAGGPGGPRRNKQTKADSSFNALDNSLFPTLKTTHQQKPNPAK